MELERQGMLQPLQFTIVSPSFCIIINTTSFSQNEEASEEEEDEEEEEMSESDDEVQINNPQIKV